MDALVDGLLEELNCDVVFKIPIFGGIPIYESVVVTWIIMAAVFLLCFFLGRNLSVENPGRRQVAVEAGVKFLNDFFSETLGEKGKDYIPYLATVIIYIGIANLIGLLQTVDKVLRETSVSRSIFLCVYEIYSENRKFSLGLCHP